MGASVGRVRGWWFVPREGEAGPRAEPFARAVLGLGARVAEGQTWGEGDRWEYCVYALTLDGQSLRVGCYWDFNPTVRNPPLAPCVGVLPRDAGEKAALPAALRAVLEAQGFREAAEGETTARGPLAAVLGA